MKFSQFGSENGKIVIYFHGAPGAPEECEVFDKTGKDHGIRFISIDRFAVDSSIKGELYYKLLAKEISKISQGKPVDFVGFSIGAFIALQTYRYMVTEVRNLHLVSTAAPLESGDYLEAMAGKQVFKLAKTLPVLFLLLSYWQGLLARIYPKALFCLLFASAVAGDKALAGEPEFQTSLTKVLKLCFTNHVQGYARDIVAYVNPWKGALSIVSVNTHIWHGAEDNWSPKQMADYLKSAIPGCSSLKIFNGQSHYSCLYRAMPEICNLISQEAINAENLENAMITGLRVQSH